METMEKNIKSKMDQINPEKKEGRLAEAIEEQTAKLPSDLFLWASLGSMAVSLTLKAIRRDEQALFVGLWAPAFLLFGIYNKLVKQLGHDSESE
ncbi:MAG TPA: hypothetical protein VK179_08830 [Bacteroidales bacterium]|nr:hypothetical protein [Bacteroidales bacterium]